MKLNINMSKKEVMFFSIYLLTKLLDFVNVKFFFSKCIVTIRLVHECL